MTEVEKQRTLENLIAGSAGYGDTYLAPSLKAAYRALAPRAVLVKAALEIAMAAGLNHCVITNVAAGDTIDIKLPYTLDSLAARFAALTTDAAKRPVSLSDFYDNGLLSGAKHEADINRPEGKLCKFVAEMRGATDEARRALVSTPVGALTAAQLRMICQSGLVTHGVMRELFSIIAIGKETGLFARPEAETQPGAAAQESRNPPPSQLPFLAASPRQERIPSYG
jgi:hypothetical protein